MHVVMIAKDYSDSLSTRQANRAAHLKYVADTGKAITAGPLLDADGNPEGSLIILEVETMAEAQAWVSADPYARAGLFREVVLHPWKKVI